MHVNRKLLGAVLCASLAVAACSDDDDTISDATGDAGASTTAASSSTASSGGSTSTTTGDDPGTPEFDASFGADGILATPISTTENDRYISVAEGPDGVIYASGFTANGDDHAFAVSRFTPDGDLDTTYGDGGTVTVNVAEGGKGAEVGRGLVVENDGSVLVAGPFEADPTATGPADLDIAVIRITAEGDLDESFGEDGIARIDLGAGKRNGDAIVADNAWGLTARDGGYAVMGVTPNQTEGRTDADYAIVGITEDGELDTNFGDDGVVVVDLGSTGDSARHIGAQDDGKILATGYSNKGGVVSPVLIRLSADGVLDDTWGDGGVASHAVLDGVAESYQFGVQGDGYVLAGYGRSASEKTVDLIVYRFDADGELDTSFGDNGVTRVDLAGQDDRARNLAVLPDGNILVVGSGKLDADDVDAMAVLLDEKGTLVETFGDDGHLLVDLGGPGDAFFGVTVTRDGSTAVLGGYKGANPEGTENDDAVIARIAL